MRFLIALCFGPLLLAGCAQFPDLDGRISESARNAPFPALINLDALLSAAYDGGDAAAAASATLSAQVAALRTRAAALRGPVVDRRTRARMAAAARRAVAQRGQTG
ncbi:MAG: hypothetical protein ACC646_12850 [Paracoccaceae bacterium]